MLNRNLVIVGCIFLAGLTAPLAEAAGKARHVVVVVWDGMRPDFVTPEFSPNAWRMAAGGVTFANHHPVYLSATEVNGTAIATGDYPAHSTIIANKEYRPEIDPTTVLHMEALEAVRKGDEVCGGHYLAVPTTAEILRAKGMRTAVAGAKGIALLHDRAARPAGAPDVTLFAGASLPEEISKELADRQGPFPPERGKPPTKNDWTTQALIEGLWKDSVPAYSLLWLNEPDASQHQYGLGSPEALAAIKNADDNLGRVIHALAAKGLLDDTDIFVVSDHGFSTIGQRVQLDGSMKKAGFSVATKLGPKLGRGEIVVVSNGGAYLLYVTGHDRETIGRLVEYLEGQECTGVILTREPMAGTFTLAQAKLDSPGAPDVFVSMAWSLDKNSNGVPGSLVSGLYDYGEIGMHGSLSRYDMHNTLLAAGPDFRKGVTDRLPTGNTDVAPTVLWILGVKPPKPMDGRVLTEALNFEGPKLKSYEPRRLESSRELAGNVWRQYLLTTEVNGVTYFDEGNGRPEPK
jgi:arylsulfatase A-like enzyme